jgi:hypothetical protein
MDSADRLTVKTSQPDWLKALAVIYKSRQPARIVDDAGLGIDPASHKPLQMAREVGLSHRELGGVCVALGMSPAGIAMIIPAFVDPEPTSKLGLLVGGGVVCVLGGGFGALRILTNLKPPSVRVTAHGIEIALLRCGMGWGRQWLLHLGG